MTTRIISVFTLFVVLCVMSTRARKEYFKAKPLKRAETLCSEQSNCSACTSQPEHQCRWCQEKGVCLATKYVNSTCSNCVFKNPPECPTIECGDLNTCDQCTKQATCGWCTERGKCLNASITDQLPCGHNVTCKYWSYGDCSEFCRSFSDCGSCLNEGRLCSWCAGFNEPSLSFFDSKRVSFCALGKQEVGLKCSAWHNVTCTNCFVFNSNCTKCTTKSNGECGYCSNPAVCTEGDIKGPYDSSDCARGTWSYDMCPLPPTFSPTKAPTTSPPTKAPTKPPTKPPTKAPTKAPTKPPTKTPTTVAPTKAPTRAPTKAPTRAPTTKPPTTLAPTKSPTTASPSTLPPTTMPTTTVPTTVSPTTAPTTHTPTSAPVNPVAPTSSPTTASPTLSPTVPAQSPSVAPIPSAPVAPQSPTQAPVAPSSRNTGDDGIIYSYTNDALIGSAIGITVVIISAVLWWRLSRKRFRYRAIG